MPSPLAALSVNLDLQVSYEKYGDCDPSNFYLEYQQHRFKKDYMGNKKNFQVV